MPSSDRWLGLLAIHSSRREELASQLAAEMMRRTGLDLDLGFGLMPTSDHPITDEHGTSYFDADLAGPDGSSVPVTIAWADKSGSGRPVSLESGDGRPIHAWWAELPEEELRARYGAPAPPMAEVALPAGVSLRWEHCALPDIVVQIELGTTPGAPFDTNFTRDLELHREQWNEPRSRGIIHNWSGLRRLGAQRFEYHVDFGSAGLPALVAWLETTAMLVAPFAPAQLTVRGYGAPGNGSPLPS
jgi:hypothetical protein